MDGTTTAVSSGALDTLMQSATKLVEFSGDCLTTMIQNPVYAFLFAGCIIGVGLTVVRMLKHTASN